ncbi:MAG: membrane protein insertion efficiency factor YidD [Vicinamibacteria bacterium]
MSCAPASSGSPARPSWPARALLLLVEAYRALLAPLLGGHCRYWPSCSVYAEEAVRLHGAARGSLLAARRLLRCHPFHPGGPDPVPSPAAKRS